jgi:hypothetical protein
MSLYQIVLSLHGLIGVVALLTFWTAGIARKGSPLHKAAGKIYLLSMAGLLAAALPLAVRIYLFKSPIAGLFLGYLWVITVTAVWTSWRAVRDKRDWKTFTGSFYRFLAWLNLASGVGVLAMGLFWAKDSQAIFVAFSMIGIGRFVMKRRFSRQPPDDPRWWLKQHLGAMIGNGVATHIAFLSIGLPKVLPMLAGPTLQNLAWLGPLVVAVIARIYLGRKFLPARPIQVPVGA